MYLKFMGRLVAILVLNVLFAFEASAQQLKVVTENWPPFNYLDDQGQVAGEVTANVQQILKLADVDYSLDLYPWSRSYNLARTKGNILIYSIYRTQEREQHFHWFCPVIKSNAAKIYLYKLSSNLVTLSSLSDAKKLRLGAMRDDNSHQYLKRMGFVDGENLDVASDEFANIKKLFAGRIDLVAQSDKAMAYRLKKMGYQLSEVTPVLELHPEDWGKQCMAMSMGSDKALLHRVSVAFETWLQQKQQ